MLTNHLLGSTIRALALGMCLTANPLTALTAADSTVPEYRQPEAHDEVHPEAYLAAVERTVSITHNPAIQSLAAQHGLNVVNVTWEDTGRFQGSSVGPNISDLTLQVETRTGPGQRSLHCLPVIRVPNFSDRTGDVPIEQFAVPIGNQLPGAHDGTVANVPLREYLNHLRAYLTDGTSWTGDAASLLAKRDTHVLVSAQACILPVPVGGEATFNPVLFNYQSRAGDPAVLAILVTREGTSATIIDNQRDGFAAGSTWGQRLFFNHHGQRASMTAVRASDHAAAVAAGNAQAITGGVQAAGHSGAETVMLIQIPLKQREPASRGIGDMMVLECATVGPSAPMTRRMEQAVIGHGPVEGPFTEIDGLPIERDERFPIRVTVQFYQASSNGDIDADEMRALAAQIESVYAQADAVGSLVVDGPRGRVTEHDGPHYEYPGWWAEFWTRHEANTGLSQAESLTLLRRLLGREAVNGAEAGRCLRAVRHLEPLVGW